MWRTWGQPPDEARKSWTKGLGAALSRAYIVCRPGVGGATRSATGGDTGRSTRRDTRPPTRPAVGNGAGAGGGAGSHAGLLTGPLHRSWRGGSSGPRPVAVRASGRRMAPPKRRRLRARPIGGSRHNPRDRRFERLPLLAELALLARVLQVMDPWTHATNPSCRRRSLSRPACRSSWAASSCCSPDRRPTLWPCRTGRSAHWRRRHRTVRLAR